MRAQTMDHNTIRLPADTPQSLRYLLFGSCYKFDSSDLDIVVNQPKNLVYGIQGAAALEPWFLFDEQQAWFYVAAMQRTRLYDTFGNWQHSQADRECCSRKRRAKSEDGNVNRSGAFEDENDRKHSIADRQTPTACGGSFASFQKFTDAGGEHLGSPALRKIVNEAGHNISDRDARWLAKNLASMDKRTVREKRFAAWRRCRARFRQDFFEQCVQSAQEGLGTNSARPE